VYLISLQEIHCNEDGAFPSTPQIFLHDASKAVLYPTGNQAAGQATS
jgi:hypothetical protein